MKKKVAEMCTKILDRKSYEGDYRDWAYDILQSFYRSIQEEVMKTTHSISLKPFYTVFAGDIQINPVYNINLGGCTGTSLEAVVASGISRFMSAEFSPANILVFVPKNAPPDLEILENMTLFDRSYLLSGVLTFIKVKGSLRASIKACYCIRNGEGLWQTLTSKNTAPGKASILTKYSSLAIIVYEKLP